MPQVDETITPFAKWNYGWNELIKHRFQHTTTSKKQREESLGLGLRSSIDENAMVDEDAFTLNTTNARQLSHFHWEDFLLLQYGDKVMIYFRHDINVLDGVFKSKPQQVAVKQCMTKVGEEVLKLGGQFLVLQAEIVQAKYHHAAWTGVGV